MPTDYLGHTTTKANADLDTLWTTAQNAAGDAATALTQSATAIADAAAAQADATAALTAFPGGGRTVATLAAYLLNNAVYNVKDFGATGDGGTDDAAAIAAAGAAAAAGDGLLFFPPGSYLLGSNVSIPKTVSIMGSGPNSSILIANTEKQLRITGGSNAIWGHVIERMGFNKVQVRYGHANTDYGNGCVLRECDSTGCTTAVYYGYNCWLTSVVDTFLHNCTTCVHIDLATAGSGSGAAMTFYGGAMFNCTTTIFVEGNTTDGHDIKVYGTDLEHATGKALRYEPDGDGSMHLIGVHMELNDDTYISQIGGNLFIKDLWAFLIGTTHNRFIQMDGDARCWLAGCSRFQWEADKLCRLLDANAKLMIDSDSVFSSNAFFGAGSAVMDDGTSTAGEIRNGGMAYLGRLAKAFTAQHNVQTGTLAPGAGSAVEIATIQAFDASPRTWEFDVRVDDVTGVNTNQLNVLLNPGGTITAALTFPIATGGGRVRVTYTPGGAFNASCKYNGTWVHAEATDTNTHTVQRFLTIYSDDGVVDGATMEISNLTELVH